MFLAWYVVIIHLVVRAVMLEYCGEFQRQNISKRSEKQYFKWEGIQIFLIYLLPYFAFFANGLFPFLVLSFLSIFVAILRSIEHINPKIIN